MTLAPDSITITDQPSGLEHAGKNVSSKFYPVTMQADADGHIQGTAPAYLLYQQPRALTAAATDFWDLFNATGSGKIIRLRGLWSAIQITAASSVVPSFQFSLIRTSAVGSGGTVASTTATAAPAAGAGCISKFSTLDADLPAQITARTLPTGGATPSAFLFNLMMCSEETNAAVYLGQQINWLPELPYQPPFELQENQGVKLRQITATLVPGTSFGWLLAFTVIP